MSASASQTTVGTIPLCQHQDCGHACCQFHEGNYILLYPGELEHAGSLEMPIDHLQVIGAQGDGQKAICRAADKSVCDGGYKPLDCASYPFFPTVDGEGKTVANLKGEKCPLIVELLATHRDWVEKKWSQLAVTYPRVANWIRQAQLVGYRRIEPPTTEEVATRHV